MQKTTDYFKLPVGQLVQTSGDYTKEEKLLFDSGLEVIFYDDEKELKADEKDFNEYIQSKNYAIKEKLLTVNERIAVVLV